MEKVKEQYSMPRCDIEELKEKIRGLEGELLEVLKILIRESPKHEAWVMKNWGHLFEGEENGN